MTPDPMPEPEGPQDERFVYVVTAAGVEALGQGAAEFDSDRKAPVAERSGDQRPGGTAATLTAAAAAVILLEQRSTQRGRSG